MENTNKRTEPFLCTAVTKSLKKVGDVSASLYLIFKECMIMCVYFWFAISFWSFNLFRIKFENKIVRFLNSYSNSLGLNSSEKVTRFQLTL